MDSHTITRVPRNARSLPGYDVSLLSTLTHLGTPEKGIVGTPAPVTSSVSRHDQRCRCDDEPSTGKRAMEKRFELLAAQFTSIVLMSTFAATLVVSFLALANDIIGKRRDRPFQIGLFLCFVAAGVHLSLALVAGRSVTIAFRYSRLLFPQDGAKPDEEERLFSKLHQCRELCEMMQFIGTSIFIPGLSFMMWYMFDDMVFPLVLYALGAVGGVWVYVAGYWQLSILGATVGRSVRSSS